MGLTAKIWTLSQSAYKRRLVPVAKLLKAVNFVVFHAVLPYEAEVGPGVMLEHYGLGIVIHPNVQIGKNVRIFHGVTLAAETWIGSPHRIIVGDDVVIGAGASVIGRGDKSLTIGDRARVGAGAVVTKDVLADQTVVGVPAKPVQITSEPNQEQNVND